MLWIRVHSQQKDADSIHFWVVVVRMVVPIHGIPSSHLTMKCFELWLLDKMHHLRGVVFRSNEINLFFSFQLNIWIWTLWSELHHQCQRFVSNTPVIDFYAAPNSRMHDNHVPFDQSIELHFLLSFASIEASFSSFHLRLNHFEIISWQIYEQFLDPISNTIFAFGHLWRTRGCSQNPMICDANRDSTFIYFQISISLHSDF